MTAIRRKRDDDSTFQSNSQCSGSLANMDASQSSMVALDASTIGTDASPPRRHRKRRRTTIVDQLQQISISNGEAGVPNQILERAANDAADDNSQTLTSSSGSEDEGDDDTNSQILPPSDLELAQRTAVRELVFGRPPVPPPPDPADRILQALVRKSLDNIKQGQHPLVWLDAPSNPITESQDDMTIEPVYTRPSDPAFFYSFPSIVPVAVASAFTMPAPLIPMPLPPQRKRSNSLPEGRMDDFEDVDFMETS